MKNRESIALNASRWTAYSAAGIAAATAGTMTSEAEAGITVIESNTTIFDAAVGFSLDGSASFVARHAVSSLGLEGAGYVGVGAVNGGFVAGFNSLYNYASNVAFGANISTANFGIAANNYATLAFRSGYGNDQFLGAGTGYIAFSFDGGAGTQYGWIEVNMDGAPLNSFEVVRYAYGMVGEAVTVGQVPAPGSMAALALGAAGIGGFRRRRSA